MKNNGNSDQFWSISTGYPHPKYYRVRPTVLDTGLPLDHRSVLDLRGDLDLGEEVEIDEMPYLRELGPSLEEDKGKGKG